MKGYVDCGFYEPIRHSLANSRLLRVLGKRVEEAQEASCLSAGLLQDIQIVCVLRFHLLLV